MRLASVAFEIDLSLSKDSIAKNSIAKARVDSRLCQRLIGQDRRQLILPSKEIHQSKNGQWNAQKKQADPAHRKLLYFRMIRALRTKVDTGFVQEQCSIFSSSDAASPVTHDRRDHEGDQRNDENNLRSRHGGAGNAAETKRGCN